MKILHNAVFVVLAAGMLFATSSCKKEKVEQGPDVFFNIAVDGLTVAFENKTTGAKSYRWDFGDGATSTEESPTHTYTEKGKYVPTLYATSESGKEYEASTVLRISKGSSVKLDDNTFNDWDTVATNTIVAGPAGGSFRKAKFDYDGNNVYFYFEIASTKASGDIFDFYIDSDNNTGTGLITGLFKESGNDILLEGAILDAWFDMFYHKGAQDAFSFDYQSVTDFYQLGTITESGGLLKFEGKLVRSKIKGLTGKGMKIGVNITKNDWSRTLGTIPEPNTPSFFLDMSE